MYRSWEEAAKSVHNGIIRNGVRRQLPDDIVSLLVKTLRADSHFNLERASYLTEQRVYRVLARDENWITADGLFAVQQTIKTLFPLTWKVVEQITN